MQNVVHVRFRKACVRAAQARGNNLCSHSKSCADRYLFCFTPPGQTDAENVVDEQEEKRLQYVDPARAIIRLLLLGYMQHPSLCLGGEQ